jgi:hypothetical protein
MDNGLRMSQAGEPWAPNRLRLPELAKETSSDGTTSCQNPAGEAADRYVGMYLELFKNIKVLELSWSLADWLKKKENFCALKNIILSLSLSVLSSCLYLQFICGRYYSEFAIWWHQPVLSPASAFQL